MPVLRYRHPDTGQWVYLPGLPGPTGPGGPTGPLGPTGAAAPIGPYVAKAGDTMTGPLVLPTGPTAPLQAASKGYVDGRRLVDLADASTTDTPAEGDSLFYTSNRWEYRPAASGGGMVVEEIPNAMDLDTYITPGIFIQSSTAEAVAGGHYPVGLAGMLEVHVNADASHVWQRYTAYGRGGAVNTDTDSDVTWQRSRYNSVWTLWKPLAWGKPTVWGNVASGWNGVPDFADFHSQNWGREVYLDTAGKLRARPDILLSNAILSSALPSAWPMGISVMGVSASGGYPGSGNVLTVRREAGEWTMQIWSTGPGSQQMRFRFGSTSWGAWEHFAGAAYSTATPLVAYSGWAMTSSYMQVHGHTAQIYGNIKRTGAAITSPGGNITNTNMCYIAAGLPYPITTQSINFVGGDTLFGGQMGSDRVVTVSAISRGSTIETSSSLIFSSIFLTNAGV